jgi:NMD protein affecting ribosome stability and mRNA decay
MRKRNHITKNSPYYDNYLESDKICSNCYTTNTCMWRKHINNSFLCNPCGVFHNRNKRHKTVFNNSYYAEILIDLHKDTKL